GVSALRQPGGEALLLVRSVAWLSPPSNTLPERAVPRGVSTPVRLAANRLPLPCSAGVRFLPRLKAGVSTEMPDANRQVAACLSEPRRQDQDASTDLAALLQAVRLGGLGQGQRRADAGTEPAPRQQAVDRPCGGLEVADRRVADGEPPDAQIPRVELPHRQDRPRAEPGHDDDPPAVSHQRQRDVEAVLAGVVPEKVDTVRGGVLDAPRQVRVAVVDDDVRAEVAAPAR